MKEPFDHATARAYVRAILGGRGMTTFPRSAAEAMMREGMMTGDLVNVLRGGLIRSAGQKDGRWIYESRTKQMTVSFCFRGHTADSAPDEVVVLTAWRSKP